MSEETTQEKYQKIKDDQAKILVSKEVRAYFETSLDTMNIVAWSNIKI